jgi:hypothetical protein
LVCALDEHEAKFFLTCRTCTLYHSLAAVRYFKKSLKRNGANKLQEETSLSSIQDIDALVTTFGVLMALLFSLSLLMFNIAIIPSEKNFVSKWHFKKIIC